MDNMENLNLPVTKVHYEFLEDCPGEIIFKSNGFGQFCLSEKIFMNTAPSNRFPMTMFEDPLLLVKKIKNPCVINQNVIFARMEDWLLTLGIISFLLQLIPENLEWMLIELSVQQPMSKMT